MIFLVSGTCLFAVSLVAEDFVVAFNVSDFKNFEPYTKLSSF